MRLSGRPRPAPPIHGGLQVVESRNNANAVLHHGWDGALTGRGKEHAETSLPPLDPLRCALARVDILPVQQVAAEPAGRKS
ncbi:hypothetical protein ACIRL2_47280 [Embleya sp. NPDC127516]|uniref:hypothetical protein n=1 Tax=Embleya sp. NPDC127516 TaxID=3363990 RepID=UPI0037F7F5A8